MPGNLAITRSCTRTVAAGDQYVARLERNLASRPGARQRCFAARRRRSVMPQLHLPMFPHGVTPITEVLAFAKRDGQVTYFSGQLSGVAGSPLNGQYGAVRAG